MALNKRIKRVIMRNKAQYIGSILLVMFSCLLFVIYNVSLRGVRANEESFIKNNVLEDAKLILQKPIDDIGGLEDRFNVLIEEGKTFDFNLSDETTVRVFSNNNKVNIPYITEGNGISNNQDIIIDPAFAKAQNIKIGDKLKIYDMEFKVTGFFALPDYMYAIKSETDLISDPKAFGIAVISKESADKIGRGYDFYNIKYNSEKSSEIKEYLAENNGIIFWQDKEENTRFTIVDGKLNAAIDMGIKLPIIIIILTCLLLAVVIWRMIKSEFIQIGTLYALGYKKIEILKHYIMYPTIIALTGGIIGTLLGVISLKPILDYMLVYFNVPTMGKIYDIYYIAISPIIPLIFLVPTGIFVTLKALKLTPVRLMRGYSSNVKVGRIEKKLKLNRFKFKTKYRIREITRNVPRTVVMVLGVTLAAMFLLFGFMEQNSMDYIINKGIKGTFKYEYNYILKKMEISNVYGGEEYNVSPFMIKDREINFTIYGLKPEGELINLENKKGEKLKVDRIIISKALAESIGVKSGETLKVTNKYNNKNYDLKIDEVAELYTTMAIYMPIDKFNEMMKLDKGSFIGIYSKDKLAVDENSIFKLENKEDTIKAFDTMIEPMKYVLAGISIIAFIIALIVIYIITSLIIEENKTSISMLKVIGYENKWINSLVLDGTIFPVIFGYLISIPLLLSSMQALFGEATKKMNISFPLMINPGYMVIGFVIIYITFVISKFISKKRVFAISMSESLKMQRE